MAVAHGFGRAAQTDLDGAAKTAGGVCHISVHDYPLEGSANLLKIHYAPVYATCGSSSLALARPQNSTGPSLAVTPVLLTLGKYQTALFELNNEQHGTRGDDGEQLLITDIPLLPRFYAGRSNVAEIIRNTSEPPKAPDAYPCGNISVTVMPSPATLAICAEPPCNSMIERTRARPRPLPCAPPARAASTR